MEGKAQVKQDKGGYYVFVKYQGIRNYITKYMGRVSFRKSEGLANTAADVIDSEIIKVEEKE